MIFDLHSHTTASDGHFSPEELVLRAHEFRVSVLAITDHDTTEGLAEAAEAIARHELPMTLIKGIEISTVWENFDIHIVGLGIDPDNEELKGLMTGQVERREARAVEISHRLEKARIFGALEGQKPRLETVLSPVVTLRAGWSMKAMPSICRRFSRNS